VVHVLDVVEAGVDIHDPTLCVQPVFEDQVHPENFRMRWRTTDNVRCTRSHLAELDVPRQVKRVEQDEGLE